MSAVEAEGALQVGDNSAAMQAINTFRQSDGLSPVVTPGTAAARIDRLFRKRGLRLTPTGHRLGDLRRLVRRFGRWEASVGPNAGLSQGR